MTAYLFNNKKDLLYNTQDLIYYNQQFNMHYHYVFFTAQMLLLGVSADSVGSRDYCFSAC